MSRSSPLSSRGEVRPRPVSSALLLAAAAACALLAATGSPAIASAQATAGASAPDVPLVPLEHFFDNPEIAGAQISPDGRWLAYLKPYRDRLNVHVREIGSDAEHRVTADTTRPIRSFFWTPDGSRLLYLQDSGGNENFHVFSVPVAEAVAAVEAGREPEAADLTPYEDVRAFVFDVPRESPDRILVGLNRRDPSLFDAHWLDLETGELELVVENPGNFGGVVLDNQLRARLAVGQGPAGETLFFTRDARDEEWREVARFPASETVGPIRFHPDDRRVYVNSNHGADFARLALLDLETGEQEEVERDPLGRADLAGALFSDLTDELLATVYNGDTVRIYPKDEELAEDLARIRQVHAGEPSVTSTTADERKFVVSFDHPRDPGATYLYDRDTGEATFLFRPRPWLEPETLADMRPIRFEARDGLEVPAYLTLPRGVEAEGLPMVLLVHGGPWARDSWGYDSEAQLLANRGYAVLQVNYRGSTGYGKDFYNAAVREFAGAMHDDLVDGVRWAVEEGIADSDRIGIYGGSYGGYATLVGLTFTPEVFACGVDYVGPSSLITLIESFPAYWRPFLEGTWFRFVGDPADPEVRADLEARSPLFHVERIEDPLLVVQGANDPRVTKREADQLVVALRDRGVRVDYMLAENEGHGFSNADNRLALYRAMETFFSECLGGRAQESVSPEIEAKIASMMVDVESLTLEEEPTYTEVAPGDGALDVGRVSIGTVGHRLLMARGGQERELGTVSRSTERVEVEGEAVIRRVVSVEAAGIGSFADTVELDAGTLALRSYRSSNPQRRLAVRVEDGRIVGATTSPGGEEQAIDVAAGGPVFSGGAADVVLSALPLAEGYAVELPTYAHDLGGLVTLQATVTAVETVPDGNGGEVAAWRVEGKAGGQAFRWWISQEDRSTVRSVTVPAPGMEIVMEP